LPVFVIHCSGFSSRWVGLSLGVSIRIVLNLRMLKCVLCMPTLFCLKSTGPGVSSLIAMISMRNIGDSIMSAIADNMISISLLIFR
jgi:hypothetical protein